MKVKNNFRIIAFVVFAFMMLLSFVAQAKIVEHGQLKKQRPDGTWYVIKYQWHESDDNSGFIWTTWTESDMPGKEFANIGHFYPPYTPPPEPNSNFNNNSREQLHITVVSPELYDGTEFDTKLLLSNEPFFKTEVIAQNNQLGVRIYFEDNEEQVTDIPILINLYEIATGKMIFENEPLKVGDSIKYFDLKNKVNNKSMYSITFKVAGEIDSRTAFYFNYDGTESQKQMK